jgi:gentisate 1,2-dioxygenase
MTELATLSDLPVAYVDALTAADLTPLWPQMRNLLPHGAPQPITKSHHWKFEAIRPLLLQAGDLTPVEKAERRVLVLSDTGRGNGAMQATSTIYCGMQLLLPGETAPAHRHTPSAARIIVEGSGGYTVVNGEKCPMRHGDIVLTPGGCWHDHGNEGNAPVIWLDALDLPLFVYLEASYAEEAPLQAPKNRPDASMAEYFAAGLAPSRSHAAAAPRYPMLRFPWERTQAALDALRAVQGPGEIAELDYINPETGESCLPTLGFTAMALTGGAITPVRRSASSMFHVISGSGRSTVNGNEVVWQQGDSFSAPVFASITHEADGSAYLIRIHDRPLQEKLGFYEER